MKKAILLLSLVITMNILIQAQVAITEDGSLPDNSAMLDIKSSNKGLLIPRMTLAERDAISTPANGLMVFVITDNSFYFNAGDEIAPNWTLFSGSGVTDNECVISGNNIFSGVTGNVGIGTSYPNEKLQIRNGNISMVSQNEDAYIKLLSDEEQDVTPAYIWSENAKGFSVGNTPGTPQFLINSYTGNVGIGTTNPSQKLSIRDGNMSIVSEGSDSYIYLGSDELGDAIGSYLWTDDLVGFSVGASQGIPQMVIKNLSGNVGIGTNDPDAKLEVAGQIKITGGTPGEGKVLTSNANGLATWQDVTETVESLDDLSDAVTDINSIFIGNYAGGNDDGNNYNTAVGIQSLRVNVSGQRNLALGTYSLFNNQSGTGNSAVGYAAMYNNEIGYSNVAIGVRALYRGSGIHNIVAVGDSTLFNNGYGASDPDHGLNNTAVGSKAMYSNTTGDRNAAFGTQSLTNNISGRFNTAIGYYALPKNISGNENTAIGNAALVLNETGNKNVAVGSGGLFMNVEGENNIAIGFSAGFQSTGSGNIFIGNEAGYDETGSNKLYIDNTNTSSPLIYGNFNLDRLSFNADVAIDSDIASGYKLSVGGKIICEELRVNLQADWPDYVFTDDYTLLPVNELDEFIAKNGHLPNIPSATVIENSGIEVGETQRLMMEKIEELTLYIIEQQKQIDELKKNLH